MDFRSKDDVPMPFLRHPYLTETRLRRHLAVLAIALWTVALIDAATPTWRLRTGQVKGTDFVHFYTLARLAAVNGGRDFGNLDTQRETQLAVRPETKDDWYPPVYGPQVSVLLAPLGTVGYGTALVTWLAITLIVYLWLVRIVLQSSEHLLPYKTSVVLGALALPAFWQLILHGQLSILAMSSVVGGWHGLRRGKPWLAGAALGVLAYKPSIALPVFTILAVVGAWRMLIGAASVSLAQLLAGVMFAGPGSLSRSLRMLVESPSLISTLAAKPYQMHSWRSFWLLLVNTEWLALTLYGLCSLVTIAAAARVWRRTTEPGLRMAALMLASVLCAPHLYVYDLVVLAPVWIWLTDWYLANPRLGPLVGWLLYAGYAAPLFGPVVARLTHVQVSVLCLGALLACLWRYFRQSRPTANSQMRYSHPS